MEVLKSIYIHLSQTVRLARILEVPKTKNKDFDLTHSLPVIWTTILKVDSLGQVSQCE